MGRIEFAYMVARGIDKAFAFLLVMCFCASLLLQHIGQTGLALMLAGVGAALVLLGFVGIMVGAVVSARTLVASNEEAGGKFRLTPKPRRRYRQGGVDVEQVGTSVILKPRKPRKPKDQSTATSGGEVLPAQAPIIYPPITGAAK